MRHYTVHQKPGGRVFFLGDIHGQLDIVANLIQSKKFNHKEDLIVSVGDLIDRGPNSLACLELVNQPWFHAVKGNHEQLLLDSGDNELLIKHHKKHGGSWFYDLCESDALQVKEIALGMPNAITVVLEDGTSIGVTHAECPLSNWQSFVDAVQQGDDVSIHSALWSREKHENKDQCSVGGVDLVVVGHTKSPEMELLGNTKYIDTGRHSNPTAVMPFIDDSQIRECIKQVAASMPISESHDSADPNVDRASAFEFSFK